MSAGASARRPARSTRSSSRARAGLAHSSSPDSSARNDDFRRFGPGETITLVDHRGAGIVRRWWVTIAPRNSVELQRQLIVRCYWVDETAPSVEVPLSEFCGAGFGKGLGGVPRPANIPSDDADAPCRRP